MRLQLILMVLMWFKVATIRRGMEGNEGLMIHFAPYGEKFHRQRECLGLLQAKRVFSAEPCMKCLKKKKIGEKVFRAEKGDMSVFHGLTACAGKRCVKLTPLPLLWMIHSLTACARGRLWRIHGLTACACRAQCCRPAPYR